MSNLKLVSRLKLVIPLLIMIQLINTCTVYYKTSDVKKNFLTSLQDANKVLGKIAKDHQAKRLMEKDLHANTSSLELAPYPKLTQTFEEMSRIQTELKRSKQNMAKLKAEFDRASKGKQKIKTKTPLYKQYTTTKTSFQIEIDNFQRLTEAYNKSSNQYIKIANSYKISQVVVTDLKKQVTTYLSDLNKNIKMITQAISENRKILSKARKQGQNKSKLSAQEATLAQMEQVVGVLSEKQTELQKLVDHFKSEVGNAKKIWSGPGMQTFTILNDLTAIGVQIKQAGDQIDKLGKEL